MVAPRMERESLQPLLSRLQDARSRTDNLFKLIAPDAIYDRPIPERHRLIFYLGHLEAFDWNLLRGALALESDNAEFDRLFSFGIDPTHGDLPTDQPADWPRFSQIQSHNKRVRQRMDERLKGARSNLPPDIADGTLLHVAIEHRLMHFETLAYLLHQLPFDRKLPQRTAILNSVAQPETRTVTIPTGTATLGQPRQKESDKRRGSRNGTFEFGWDNEFEAHMVEVPEFSIDMFPVTNGEHLDFVQAGGYDEASLWDAEDWEWKQSHEIQHPFLWQRSGDRWLYRAMFNLLPLPLDWPVYVSHAEASAYARWIRKSLPTEAQWHRAAYGSPKGNERCYPWGEEAPDASRGNFDFERWDPTPVTAHPKGASAFGVQDLLGDGWEWTSTPFAPFAGFERFPFYPGYSADFFDGRHFVMKGGSPCTAECFLRRPFRNWFQPRYPYVYATFRCVEDGR
jgi:gamma-glutamyl hercynylcysteine S-oxide synthase